MILNRESPKFRRLAALVAAIALCLSAAVSAPALAVPTGPNLVVNPGLETGTAWPECFSASGWGTEATWGLVAGHSGARAVSLTIAGYASGDRKLVQSESMECAPVVQAGAQYEAAIWYKATAPVAMTVFRHTATGWTYWGELDGLAASADWTQASAVTPKIPEGTDRISFGISLSTNGTLVTDDYSLRLDTAAEPSNELIANGTLAAGTTTPTCFLVAGWGERTVDKGISADVPPGSPAGSRSYRFTVTNAVSGDIKLIQSEATNCAPPVTPGTDYDLSINYKATEGPLAITLFKHTAAGWSYWTDIKELPVSADWTTGTASLPVVPADVDRVSFGISMTGNGELFTTGYSLKKVVPEEVPPTGPATSGTWSVLETQLPIRGLHTTLLNDGRLLIIAGSGNNEEAFNAGTFTASVWDPDTNVFTTIPVPYDMFCVGHVTLPDGKVLLAGGTLAYPANDAGPTAFKGSNKSYYFDPEDDQFHPLADMAGAHWYPSLTKLANGDIWSAGGIDDKAEGTVLTEMFDWSTMQWLPANQVPQTWSFWGTYPHMYLLDDGTLFYSGGHTFGNGLPGTGASLYDWQTAQIWDVPGLRVKDLRDQAGSVLLPPAQDQRVMIVGGGNTESGQPATNLVDIIDLSVASPTYVPGPTLPGPGKMYVNLVTLPDRTVFSANGATYNRAGDISTAAIYTTATNTWASIAPDPVPRNYHSTAILLPDGRVVIFGSNPADNSFEPRVSIYSPPYLHRGTRPTVSGAPEITTYGASFDLAVTGDVVSASLMAPMSATHQTDTNARLVDLPLAGVGGTRTAQIPDNANLLPPGPYMLTVLDSTGVPSVASWVWIS